MKKTMEKKKGLDVVPFTLPKRKRIRKRGLIHSQVWPRCLFIDATMLVVAVVTNKKPFTWRTWTPPYVIDDSRNISDDSHPVQGLPHSHPLTEKQTIPDTRAAIIANITSHHVDPSFRSLIIENLLYISLWIERERHDRNRRPNDPLPSVETWWRIFFPIGIFYITFASLSLYLWLIIMYYSSLPRYIITRK